MNQENDVNDYMAKARSEVEWFLEKENIDKLQLTEEIIDQMAYDFYKNYYYYEMDDDYAMRAAVSVVLKEQKIVIDGFEEWLP